MQCKINEKQPLYLPEGFRKSKQKSRVRSNIKNIKATGIIHHNCGTVKM